MNAIDDTGNSLLHLAARRNNKDVIEEFIADVNVDMQNSEQETGNAINTSGGSSSPTRGVHHWKL